MTKQTKATGRVRVSPPAALQTLALLSLLLLPAAARAQWTTNGASTMTTTTNSVGVGTASPAFGKLQVNKTVRIDTITGAPGLYIGTTGGGGHLQYNSGGGLDLWQYSDAAWRRTITFARTGFVGIGTTSPLNQFHVNSAGFGMIRVSGSGAGGVNFRDNAAGPNQKQYQWYSRAGKFYMALTTDDDLAYARANILVATAAGNVGVGTESPASPLDVAYSDNNFGFGVNVTNTSASPQSLAGYGVNNSSGARVGQFVYMSPNYTAAALKDTVLFSSAGPTAKLGFVSSADGSGTPDIYFRAGGTRPDSLYIQGGTGNVGVGTSAPAYKLDVAGAVGVGGNLNVTGNITGANIQATYQDVAEWVPSVQKLSAGTVVVLDAARTNHVVASSTPYDTKVAGVVSAEPGVILGAAGEDKLKVATTGRVRVKVDATRAPIRVGDLLVTSDTEGVAMKSEPVEVGGRKLHAPGTIIGKALEPLEAGTGEILVLLSLQ